jgi:hypothetical protein
MSVTSQGKDRPKPGTLRIVGGKSHDPKRVVRLANPLDRPIITERFLLGDRMHEIARRRGISIVQVEDTIRNAVESHLDLADRKARIARRLFLGEAA